MISYFFRRILWAFPTLIIISLVVFGLTKCTSDPVLAEASGVGMNNMTEEQFALYYQEEANRLGFDKPLFYLTLTSRAYPDTFFKILPPERRDWLDKVLGKSGQPELALTYLKGLQRLGNTIQREGSYESTLLSQNIKQLRLNSNLDDSASRLRNFAKQNTVHKEALNALLKQVKTLNTEKKWSNLLVPKILWHGLDNQYHHWVGKMLRGDWGKAKFGKPVWEYLSPMIGRTFLLGLCSLFFSILFSIPLGLCMAKREGSRADRIGQRILVGLRAVPAFWLGSILILVFATPYFGIDVFPYSCSDNKRLVVMGSTWQWFLEYSTCLILPIFTQTVLTMSILTLQMRSSAVEVAQKDYVKTARIKGLPEYKVWLRHILPNAFFPMVTLFAGVLPALFGGSIIIEVVFGIPGMGQATFSAFGDSDHNVLFAIVMVTAFLTVLGTLLADLLYAWLDPRVRY